VAVIVETSRDKLPNPPVNPTWLGYPHQKLNIFSARINYIGEFPSPVGQFFFPGG